VPATRSPRHRILSLALGLLVPTLIPVVIAGSLAVRSAGDAQSALAQREASAVAARIATRFDQTLHERAATLRLTATSSALAEVYRHPRRADALQSTVSAELTRVQALDPDLTQEICLLDADGAERAQLVGGQALDLVALSLNESESVWEAPSLALRAGQVHQQSPYVSPDTGTWVISTSVPVVVNERRVAVLHSEIGIEPLRTRLLGHLASGLRARVVDPVTGTVIADSTATTPAPTPDTVLSTASLPRARPMTTDAGGAARIRTATTADGWQVEVLAPAADTPLRLLTLLTALAALTVVSCVLLAHQIVGRSRPQPPVPSPRADEPGSARTSSADDDEHTAEQGEQAHAGADRH